MTLIEIRRMGNGWAVVARAWCECAPTRHAVTTRSAYGYTIEAAVKRFRFARREAWLIEEATA